MKIALCQISNRLINPSSGVPSKEEEYFDLPYSKVPGYHRPEHFWEIPLWIAKASYCMPNAELYIVTDVRQAIEDLAKYDAVLFSVLEVNRKIISDLLVDLPEKLKVILGGYVTERYALHVKGNVEWYNTLQEGIKSLGFEYKEGTSYRLFKGEKTIPRLTLSNGCLNHCKFCSIPNEITEESRESIYRQVYSMADLDFELVYVNDKTFGQSRNFTCLIWAEKAIKKYNPKFHGFIIQTTATHFLALGPIFLQESRIKFVEIGVESFNTEILKSLKKPHTTELISSAVNHARVGNIKIIPNIMVGLAGRDRRGYLWTETRDTYRNTVNFLLNNKDIISHINLYTLTLYEGTRTANEIGIEGNQEGAHEKLDGKTWLANLVHREFFETFCEIGKKLINKK